MGATAERVAAAVGWRYRGVRAFLVKCWYYGTKRGFWRASFVRAFRRRPFWFTGKHGIRLELYPTDNLVWRFDRNSNFDDDATLAVVDDVLAKGMTVFDVGANMGAFSLYCAAKAGETGSVYAFEPTRQTFERLTRNAAAAPSSFAALRLEQAAAGASSGTTTFYEFPASYSVWNSMHAHSMHAANGKLVRPVAEVQVPVVALDDYCEQHGIDGIDLLKIDTEGHELDVLHGCRRLLGRQRIARLLFEVSEETLAGLGGMGVRDVVDAVCELGFDVWRIETDGRRTPVAGRGDLPGFANYYALPSGPPPATT